MTGFEITTIILATITTVLTAYTIYRDYFRDVSKKLSNKLMIKRIDYGQSYGSADDQTKGLTIFTIDIYNTNSDIVNFHSVSLKFTYHSKIKYIVVIGHPLVINPEETQSIHAITYILDGPELVVYPTLPLQITDVDLKSNESRKSLDSRFAEYQKQINRNRKRFQNIDQFKNKLTKVLSEAFNIRSGSQKEIKDIVKTMQISLTFQTTNGIFSIKQLIYLSMNKSLIS